MREINQSAQRMRESNRAEAGADEASLLRQNPWGLGQRPLPEETDPGHKV